MEQTNRGLERKRYESDKDYNKRLFMEGKIKQIQVFEKQDREHLIFYVNKFLEDLEPEQVKKIKYSSYIQKDQFDREERWFIVYITYYKNME